MRLPGRGGATKKRLGLPSSERYISAARGTRCPAVRRNRRHRAIHERKESLIKRALTLAAVLILGLLLVGSVFAGGNAEAKGGALKGLILVGAVLLTRVIKERQG